MTVDWVLSLSLFIVGEIAVLPITKIALMVSLSLALFIDLVAHACQPVGVADSELHCVVNTPSHQRTKRGGEMDGKAEAE